MTLSNRPTPLGYRDAGVDVDAGTRLVERIRPAVARTRRDGVLGGIGGFGGLFEVPVDRYRRPVLVAGADGVGTKLRLALETGRHAGVGIDLVAMCVNDVLAQGAEPLFFLDYYATARLDEAVAATVIEGIAEGCVQAGCALLGGETAEMPGMYAEGDYDLAGFCVGVAERERLISGERIRAGDLVVALASSGPHSNGYSLIRALLARAGPHALQLPVGSVTLEDALIAPTRIYARAVKALLDSQQPERARHRGGEAAVELQRGLDVRGIAHVTGGGLTDNLPRMLPDGLGIALDTSSWQRPPVFDWLQETAACDDAEMHRTFNCGIGLAVCVPSTDAPAALDVLAANGETAWVAGEVVSKGDGEVRVEYR